MRESYAAGVERRWVARHVGVPPVEVRGPTRGGALGRLEAHVRGAFVRVLSEAARG